MRLIAAAAAIAAVAVAHAVTLTAEEAAMHARLGEEMQRAVDEGRYAAPTLDVSAAVRRFHAAKRPLTAGNYTPTVMMHGLGDAGSNPGMQSLAKTVMDAYPGSYAVAVDVADGFLSFIEKVQSQTDELAAAILSDDKLRAAGEINLVGLSQGGLIVRAYVQQYAGRGAHPRVKNLVTVSGVHNGIYDCPLEIQIIPFLCSLFESNPYRFLFNGSIPLSFSDYAVSYWNQSLYLSENEFLPYINNQIASANSSAYTAALASVNKILLAEATQDEVVYPYQSEQFGGWAWTNNGQPNANQTVFEFTAGQGEQWTEDLLGLRTMVQTQPGKLNFASFDGGHLDFNSTWWADVVLPYLN